jgi:hypothetical protein
MLTPAPMASYERISNGGLAVAHAAVGYLKLFLECR